MSRRDQNDWEKNAWVSYEVECVRTRGRPKQTVSEVVAKDSDLIMKQR